MPAPVWPHSPADASRAACRCPGPHPVRCRYRIRPPIRMRIVPPRMSAYRPPPAEDACSEGHADAGQQAGDDSDDDRRSPDGNPLKRQNQADRESVDAGGHRKRDQQPPLGRIGFDGPILVLPGFVKHLPADDPEQARCDPVIERGDVLGPPWNRATSPGWASGIGTGRSASRGGRPLAGWPCPTACRPRWPPRKRPSTGQRQLTRHRTKLKRKIPRALPQPRRRGSVQIIPGGVEAGNAQGFDR